jgi:hypothetical protein
VPLELLPGWFAPLVELSPLTYFARGVRVLTYEPAITDPYGVELGVVIVLAVGFFAAGAYAIPRTD